MTKNEFLKIYEYAYDKLFKIRLMTNLSLLDNETIDFLVTKRPMLISTSLYGFSEETYSIFTKRNHVFQHVVDNIKRLRSLGIRIKVKVIATTVNQHELESMERFFLENNIERFYYFKIYNFTDGNTQPKKISD